MIAGESQPRSVPAGGEPDAVAAEHFRRQLVAAAENATLALFVMDEHQQCTYMNPAAERLTGYTLAEVQGRPLHDVIHHTRPDGRPYPLEECPIDQAFPQNLREQGEEVFVHRDGHFYPVAFTASPVIDQGRAVGTVIEVRDISEDKRAEAERERLLQELELERARLRSVFQQAPAIIAVVRGPHHVFEMANPYYLQLIGHREVIGRSVREALPEVVEQGFVDLLDQVYHTGRPYVGTGVQLLLQREANGPMEERFVDFVYQPLLEADGSVSGILAHGVDVTEQVRTRRELEEISSRYRFLSDATEVLVSSLDPRMMLKRFAELSLPQLGDYCFFDVVIEDGRIQRIAWAHVDPVKQTQMDAIFTLAPPLSHHGHPVSRALNAGQPMFHPEVDDEWMRKAATSETHLQLMRKIGIQSIMTIPLIVGDRRLGALTFGFSDSGRRHTPADLELAVEVGHRAAAALQQARIFEAAQKARAEAEEANRAKGEFLAAMSHELRTPLNAIGGYTQLLDLEIHGPLTDPQRDALSRINTNQQHLLALIQDILSFAKLEAGRVELNIEPVPVRRLFETLEPLIAPQVAVKGIEYSVAQCDAELHLLGDEERVRQILLNLVGNSLKFTPAGGRVMLWCDAEGDAVCIRVRDDGPGIPLEKHTAIFEPFMQVERRLDRPQEGVGLGLAISRDLARAMGGDLSVDSQPGEGSTFTLRLPRAGLDSAEA